MTFEPRKTDWRPPALADAEAKGYVHVPTLGEAFYFPVIDVWFSLGRVRFTTRLAGPVASNMDDHCLRDAYLIGTDMTRVASFPAIRWPRVEAGKQLDVTWPAIPIASIEEIEVLSDAKRP